MCGTTAVATLHTADAYGNVRTAGGEVVSAHHATKGARGTTCRIKDNGNGTYALRCDSPVSLCSWPVGEACDAAPAARPGA